MPMQLADGDLIAIIEWAKASPEIAEVWLFGSRARGDNREDSDFDLAVVTVGDTAGERLAVLMDKVGGWRETLKLSSEPRFQPYPENEECELLESVKRDGIRLYP